MICYEEKNEECFICSKFMNIKLRLPIKCEFCNYIACTECVKRYLKEIKIDPHCMNVDCKTKWTTKYLSKIFNYDNMSHTWLNNNNENHYHKEFYTKHYKSIENNKNNKNKNKNRKRKRNKNNINNNNNFKRFKIDNKYKNNDFNNYRYNNYNYDN